MSAAVRLLAARAAGVLALLAVLLAVAAPASAEDSVGEITRFDVEATFAADGSAVVELDFDYDFGDEEAHGPFLVVAERQEIADDPDHYRVMEISDVSAESDGDAPDDLRVEREDGAVQIYVGDEDVEITGSHRYRVSYRITGLVDPVEQDGGTHDELFWNAVAPGGFDIPLNDVSVRVTGPGDIEATACYTGRSASQDSCEADSASGATAEFSQSRLEEGEGLSVVAGWPSGTFTGAEPVYAERRTFGNTMQLTGITGGAAGLATLLGSGAAIAVATRRGRDADRLDATPGVVPGQATRRSRRRPVEARLTPPDGVRPGEIGTLDDEVADPRDVAATLVDLAVRGFLRIEEVAPTKDGGDVEDWRLVPLRDEQDDTGLEDYEAELLDRIFAAGDADADDAADPATADAEPVPAGSVALSELAGDYALAVGHTQKSLYRAVTDHGWFRADPSQVRTRWAVWGASLGVLGLVVGLVLFLVRAPVVLAVPLVVVGIVVAVAGIAAPARTAAGAAVLAQARGFRQHLEDVAQDRVRVEDDVFSRYLPYAIVFKLTDGWAERFADRAAQGGAPDTGWYVGAVPGVYWWSSPGGFAASIGAFAGAATTAATSSGAGGSGFSGSVGGGAGGTGGGSW